MPIKIFGFNSPAVADPNVIGADYINSWEDSVIREGQPTIVGQGSNTVEASRYNPNDSNNSIIKIPAITTEYASSDVINSAILRYCVTGNQGFVDGSDAAPSTLNTDIQIRPVLLDWDQATATWIKRDSVNNWNTPGAVDNLDVDNNTVVTGTYTTAPGTGTAQGLTLTWIEFDVTAIVANIVSSGINDGFQLSRDPSTTPDQTFTSFRGYNNNGTQFNGTNPELIVNSSAAGSAPIVPTQNQTATWGQQFNYDVGLLFPAGTPPYSFTATNLPNYAIGLNATTGQVLGTPNGPPIPQSINSIVVTRTDSAATPVVLNADPFSISISSTPTSPGTSLNNGTTERNDAGQPISVNLQNVASGLNNSATSSAGNIGALFTQNGNNYYLPFTVFDSANPTTASISIVDSTRILHGDFDLFVHIDGVNYSVGAVTINPDQDHIINKVTQTPIAGAGTFYGTYPGQRSIGDEMFVTQKPADPQVILTIGDDSGFMSDGTPEPLEDQIVIHGFRDVTGEIQHAETSTIFFAPSNQNPVISSFIPDQNIGNGSTLSLDLSLYFSDPDIADTLTYSEVTNFGSVSGDTFTYSPANDSSLTITVRATDNDGLFIEDSFSVSASAVVIPDTTKPVISLTSIPNVNLAIGDSYSLPTYEATDDVDGVITGSVIVGGDTVNTAIVGAYTVTLNVSDSSNNVADEVSITYNVSAPVNQNDPVIQLLSAPNVTIVQGGLYTVPQYSATDDLGNNITTSVVVGGDTVDPSSIGAYSVTLDVDDSDGNSADTIIITYNVVSPVVGTISDILHQDYAAQVPYTTANVDYFVVENNAIILSGVVSPDNQGRITMQSPVLVAGRQYKLGLTSANLDRSTLAIVSAT